MRKRREEKRRLNEKEKGREEKERVNTKREQREPISIFSFSLYQNPKKKLKIERFLFLHSIF